MRNFKILLSIIAALVAGDALSASGEPLYVVTTLPDYAVIAEEIGGDRVEADAIVKAGQDAHFIRPKPSFVDMVRKADVLIDTGLDLEMWLPTVIDKSGNSHVRSDQDGYVAASKDMHMLEKPAVMSRAEGGLHVYGNPHVTCSPVNMRVAARNIATGLIKNDPGGEEQYREGLNNFIRKIDLNLFGEELVEILGGDLLCKLARKEKLIPFLKEKRLEDKALIEYLGGWLKEMLPLRGTPIVTYHKNWVYFEKLFGIEEAGNIEPKPGIPPSPQHVLQLTEMMREKDIGIILAADYFSENKIRAVAKKVNAQPVIVPIYVGGKDTENYIELVDLWVESLLTAAKEQDVIE